jgi:hypothetical protein
MESNHKVSLPHGKFAKRAPITWFEVGVLLASGVTIAVLVLPLIHATRESSRRATCGINLARIGSAILDYESTHRSLPSSHSTDTRTQGSVFGLAYPDASRNGLNGWGWGTKLLPMLEQASLYDRIDLSKPCWDPSLASLTGSHVERFLCPSASAGSLGFEVQMAGADAQHGVPIKGSIGNPIRFGHSHYAVNSGTIAPWDRSMNDSIDFSIPEVMRLPKGFAKIAINGPFYPNSKVLLKSITDGLSQTIFVGEHSSIVSHKTWVGVVPTSMSVPRLDVRPWKSNCRGGSSLVAVQSGPDPRKPEPTAVYTPNNPLGHTDSMWSEHGAGSQCLLGDGSVKFQSAFINPKVWVALATCAGGEDAK